MSLRLIRRILVCWLILTLPPPARARMIHADPGMMSNAAREAQSGDTLILSAARYAGSLHLGIGVGLEGNGAILEVGSDTGPALLLAGSNSVQNLFVHGRNGSDVGIRVLRGPVRLARVHVRGFRRYGVRAGNGEGIFSEGSVQDCGEDGLSAAGGRWTIRSSRFAKNGDDGIDLFRANSSIIASCVFDENGDAAVELSISPGVQLIGNASRGHRVTCAARLGDLPARFGKNSLGDRAFLERRGEPPVTDWNEFVRRTENSNARLPSEFADTLSVVPVEINVVQPAAPATGAPAPSRPAYNDGMAFAGRARDRASANLLYAGLVAGDIAMKNALGMDTLISPLLRRVIEDPMSVGTWLAERGRDADSSLIDRYRHYVSDLVMAPGPARDTLEFAADNPKVFAESVIRAWNVLDSEFQKSFGAFDSASLAKLSDDLQAQYAEEPELGLPLVEDFEFDIEMDRKLRNLMNTASRVDMAALFGSGETLMRLMQDVGASLQSLKGRMTARQLAQPVIHRQNTPWGSMVIAGAGDNRHDSVSGFVFDLGGNDRYAILPGVAPALIVDLSGNDVYDGDVASGVARLSGVWDGGGDDRYRSGSRSQGSGLLGCGILIDASGDDEYSASRYSQGFGFFGVGWLHDGGGDDVYHVPGYGQGFGGVRGLGVVSDVSGNDRYEILPVNNDPIRDPSRTMSMGQGIGDGLRPQGAGGIGILWDGGGRDEYQADLFAQGIGYWYGFGALIDVGGANDQYTAYHYVQGAGVHLSVGALYDDGGNDRYSAWYVSQGCGHDASVGALYDAGGNDIYSAYGLSQGAGSTNGVGMLCDGSGRDAYMGVARMSGQGDAWYQARLREYGSVGLLIDLGGGGDYYATGSLNNAVWFKGDHGLGVDE